MPYTYYHLAAFNVSRVFPLGGPLGGESLVSVYLDRRPPVRRLGRRAARALLRVFVRGGGGRARAQGGGDEDDRVDAELADCGGARACGAGWGSITCQAPPPLDEITRDGDARDVRVEVTVNGQNYTDGGVLYRRSTTRRGGSTLPPRAATLGGNTSLAVTGMRLQRFGRCALPLRRAAPAGERDGGGVDGNREFSPPHWRWRGVTEDGAKRAAGEGGQDAAVQLVDLEITLNGQATCPTSRTPRRISYYALDAAAPLASPC